MLEYNKFGHIYDFSENKFFSNDELLLLISARIKHYRSSGIEHGDKVIVAHGNNYLFFCDLLALWNIGVCVIPVDPGLSVIELRNLGLHSGANHLIVRNSEAGDKFQDVLGNFNFIFSENIVIDKNAENIEPFCIASLEDDALLLYTSGTTGLPKGVVHTHRSIAAKIATLNGVLDQKDLRVSLNLLPTHFGHGLICNCLYPFLSGNTLILLPAFSLEVLTKLGKIIDQHNVTFMSSVPAVWKIVTLQSAPPLNNSLKRIHCGSAPLGKSLIEKIKEWSKTENIYNVYGITEVGSWIGGSLNFPHSTPTSEDGFIGQPWGAEFIVTKQDNISIIKEHQVPTICDSNEIGYIWIRTPTLMKNYLKNEEITAESIVGSWFFTGDKGKLDQFGNLILKGRVRNEINKGGIKIMPEDIDMQLEKHPAVIEACAFAVDDDISGQDVNVAVVLDDTKKIDEVKSWLRNNISSYKVPSRWYVLKAIPKTDRGKVNRATVAQFCLGCSRDEQ